MRNPLRVRFIKRVRDLDRDIQKLAYLEWPTCDSCIEGDAFDKFHRNEVRFTGLSDLIDMRHVGMRQR